MRPVLAAVALLVLLTAPAVYALAEAPPSIFLGVEPSSPSIEAGDNATLTVSVYPQGKWTIGHISFFNVTNLPKGVTATFNPQKIDGIPTNGVASTKMTIKATPDAAQGRVVLTVFAFGREDQEGVNLNASIEVPLKITPAIKTTSNTTSTVKTSTNTTTTTTTLSRNTTSTVATKTNLTTITLTSTSYNTVTSLATGSRSTYAGVVKPTPAPDITIPVAAFIIVIILLAIAFLALRGKIG
ncbi:MAG: hypothetical protein M1503_09685 [Thaumarchaeota archaeon]|nr:hypothetical protein [Nitrososphaerota archaeon]MCL5318510.1 hypothetical protein [Nitrososphaerota archaeon]